MYQSRTLLKAAVPHKVSRNPSEMTGQKRFLLPPMSVPPMGLSGGRIFSGGQGRGGYLFLRGCHRNQALVAVVVVPATEVGEV